MPTYCFKCECGHAFEQVAPITVAPRYSGCQECGRMAPRFLQAEHPNRHVAMASVDHVSEAMAVHPGDARKRFEEDRRFNPRSAPDHYDPQGRPHWTGDLQSVMHRKRQYLRERSYFEKNSYT